MKDARTQFETLRSRARRGILVEGFGLGAAACAGYMLFTYGVDRMLRLEWPFRLVLLGGLLYCLGRIWYRRVHRPLTVELTDDEFALAVERHDPAMKQELISAVQFERVLLAGVGPNPFESPDLMMHVIQGVKERWGQIPFHRALDAVRVRKFALMLAVGVIAPSAFVAIDGSSFALWAKRNLFLSSVEWPRYTSFSWLDSQTRIPQGEDLTIRVDVGGPVPDQVFLYYRFASGDDGAQPMSQTGEREFSITMESVLEDVDLHVEGGDGLSESLHITVVERPRIEDLRITLEYPSYMGKENLELGTPEGDLKLPLGGILHLQARSHKPAKEGFLLLGQTDKVALTVAADGHTISGTLEPKASVLMTVDVIDRDDLGCGSPPRIFLRMTPDQSPRVDFKVDGVGNLISPRAMILGEIEVRDDFGLRSVVPHYRVSGRPEGEKGAAEQEAPWLPAEMTGLDAFEPNEEVFEATSMFDVKTLNPKIDKDPAAPENRARPGQRLSIRFTATDNFGPGAPHATASEILTWSVVTESQLVEELMRRQIEQKRELERVLAEERDAQLTLKEIRDPGAGDAGAARARARVRALSRQQKAMGRRVQHVGAAYDKILAEYRNNRVWTPPKVRELRDLIVVPLQALALADFPATSRDVARFAVSGGDELRSEVVNNYEVIIKRISEVLKNMEDAENLAALVEGLREVIKREDIAIRITEKRRDEAGQKVFAPDKNKDQKNRPDK